MAATTISRATLTDSVSAITGDIWNAALVGTSIYDKIDALFAASLTIERSSVGDITFTVSNASNTAGSDAQLAATVAGTTAGDPYATFTVTSGSTFSIGVDNSDSDTFKIAASAALGTTDTFGITTGGRVHIGTAFTNAFMTVGLSINQAGNDDEIFSMKSSDIAHGMTALSDTDTFGRFRKYAGATGGLLFSGFSSSNPGIFMQGVVTTVDTTKATTSTAGVMLMGYAKSATSAGTVGANANCVAFGDGGTVRHILDADGDSHQDVGTTWTNFDDHADIELLHALSAGVSRKGDPLKRAFRQLLTKHRDTLQAARIVTFNKNGHHFINWSRLHMLMVGAVRQQADSLAHATARIAALEQRLLTV